LSRYLTYSTVLHFVVLALALYLNSRAEKPQVYYGFQFLGGQSGLDTGKLEPAPAPLTTPAASPGPAPQPAETPPVSEDPDRIAVPKTPDKKSPGPKKSAPETTEGRNTKKGKGIKGGRGESSFGHGDFQGSKLSPVGGIGTSLEIGGFGPGSGGATEASFPYKWYSELVYKRLWESWDRTDAGTRECKVAFIIQRDGQVSEVRVKGSSGDAFFDMTARRAVTGAAPFPPLPDAFTEKSLPVLVRFRLQESRTH